MNDRSQNGSPNTYTAKTSILFGTGFETTTNDYFETNINPEAGPCDIAGQTLSTTDMGDDGTPNSPVAKDAYSFTLHYFDDASGKDYVPIGAAEPLITSIPASFNFSLYNGNIGAMSVNVTKAGDALLYTYHYDQLNRLISMDAFRGWNPNTNSWEPVAIDDYRERVSYDANGNIKTYTRNGDAARTAMDDLVYTYKANTNQLDKVAEAATDANITEYDKYNDIKQGQTSGNYQYDAIGNLASDASEGISNIDWTVYGKIKSITKTGSNISYSYDASGNRISKEVDGKETWYVRDASGNIMSVYSKDASVNAGHLTQSEISLYGSSRLGVLNLANDVQSIDGNTGRIYTFTRGNKFFELSNHLGNVLATVSDKRVLHSTDGTTVDYYQPEVVSAQDYYPFGMLMPGRKYSIANTNYRYGFNGQEKSTEINSSSYTAEFWQYDSRIGRRWNIDPVVKTWESGYVAFSNNPVWHIDFKGNTDSIPTSLATKTYDASSWWSPLTKVIPNSGAVEHSHADDINNIYQKSGGDAMFNSNASTITQMNSSLKPVKGGSIIEPVGSPAVTNLNSAYYSSSESGSQIAWINLMLGGMIKGNVPENIVFSENGTVSNYLRGSAVLNKAVRDWYKNGQSSVPFGVNYGGSEQLNDVGNNLSFFTMGNFVGSAMAQITYSTDDDILRVTITNVTSVHSGDYMKHMYWHNQESPFLLRNPNETKPQPYTNFSQTYQLKFSYKSIIEQIGNEYKLIE